MNPNAVCFVINERKDSPTFADSPFTETICQIECFTFHTYQTVNGSTIFEKNPMTDGYRCLTLDNSLISHLYIQKKFYEGYRYKELINKLKNYEEFCAGPLSIEGGLFNFTIE